MRNLLISLILISVLSLTTKVFCQTNSTIWAQNFGNKGWDHAHDIFQLQNKNYILGGSIHGDIFKDTANFIIDKKNKAWIASLDSLGNMLWQKSFLGSEFSTITSISDFDDSILVAGIFQDTLYIDSLSLTSQDYSSGFVSLLDQSGKPIWLKKSGDNATISNILITKNELNGKFVTGTFSGELTLANQTLSSNVESGIFLYKLQNDGSESFPSTILGTGDCRLGGISGNDSIIIIAGSFSDTLKIADSTFISIGDVSGFIATFDHFGTFKWIQIFGGIGCTTVSGISINDNEIEVTGNFNFSSLFGFEIKQSIGEFDVFTSALDLNGNFKWTNTLGGISNDYSYALCSDNNHLYISGSYNQLINIESDNGQLFQIKSLSPFGNAFVAKYNKNGSLDALFNLPGTSEDYLQKFIINQEKLTSIGNFYGTIQLGNIDGQPMEISSIGSKDILILQFKDNCQEFIINAGDDSFVCPNDSILLNFSQNVENYYWFPGGQMNQDLYVTAPGFYYVIAINEFGCISMDSLLIDLVNLPIAYAGSDTTINACPSITLNGLGENLESYLWETSGNGYFSNIYDYNTNYNISNNDISTGQVNLFLTGENICGSVSDSLLLTILMDEDGVIAYPNPTNGFVNIVCEAGITIQNITITRQPAFILENQVPVNGIEFSYNLQTQPPGSYLFFIVTNQGVVSKMVTKL